MNLNLSFQGSYCGVNEFVINGISADINDFGQKYDNGDIDRDDCGCSNMMFTRYPARTEILDKYEITIDEYSSICKNLEDGLSFGCCGLCE